MTSRVSPALFAVAVAIVIADPRHTALAAWGPDGITVRATTSQIPIVAACTDGASGTFVAWMEVGTAPAGLVRVQHLLSTGDVDPAWPADGGLASGIESDYRFVEVLPDRLGGVYVLWGTGPVNYLTRLDPGGQVAAGWPASGKWLGGAVLANGAPRIIEDGTHGVYATWVYGEAAEYVVVRRLGPDLAIGGWSRTVASSAGLGPAAQYWPDLALAPDGGVFVSWATWSSDTTLVPSGMFLRRLTGAGANSPEWPPQPKYLGPLDPEDGVSLWAAPLLDISPDGRGGLFWIAGSAPGSSIVRLHRMQTDGTASPDWWSGGLLIPGVGYGYFDDWQRPDEGLRVHADGQDGALIEVPSFHTHTPHLTDIRRYSEGGGSGFMEVQSAGHEVVPKSDGGVFAADFNPTTAIGPYQPEAFLAVRQSYAPPGWSGWGEVHTDACYSWYGDIALAGTGSEGVVFFWSQHCERFGLFARRFTNTSQVTGVEPEPGPGTGAPGLHGLRFVDGTGVVAGVILNGFPARLDLFDVGGRRISAQMLEGLGAATDVVLPGSASLPAGLYFARLAWEGPTALGKVAVVR